MPRKKHSDPNCQCCICKAKRGEFTGKNNPMYGKGYLLIGKKNGMYGKKRAKHKINCTCYICKAERGEFKGKNNPFYNKKHKKSSKNKMRIKAIGKYSGKNNPSWKSEEYQNANGYWVIWIDGIKYLRSRYTAEQCLKRKLTSKEVIHHISKDPSDDRPENLYVFSTTGKHSRHHHLKNPPILISNLI